MATMAPPVGYKAHLSPTPYLGGAAVLCGLLLAELRERGLTRLSLIEVEHKIAMLEAERNWVRKLEKEITDGKLEWVVGIDTGDEKLRRKHGASAN